jgi:hypothetical protein
MPTTGAYEFKLAAQAVDFKISEDRIYLIEKGEWAWIDLRIDTHGWLLMFRCPDCGETGALWQDGRGHTIDSDGNVTPSVLHSWTYAGVERCGFHTQPTKLLGFVDLRNSA